MCVCVCVYEQGLALHNQQWLICHKTKTNQIFHKDIFEPE